MTLADPLKVVLKLTVVLDQMHIRYLVGGSLASSLHGVPRATQDVDVVAEIDESHIERLASALEPEFVVEKSAMYEALRRRSSFNIIDKEDVFKVDVFVSVPDSLGRMEMGRRVRYNLAQTEGVSLFLCSAEDIVVRKLLWYQLGGGVSERQWSDVQGVLKVQGDALDTDYCRTWAEHLGLTALLDKAFAEAAG